MRSGVLTRFVLYIRDTTEELLGDVFSIRSVPMLHKEWTVLYELVRQLDGG
jgi:hypothetical protein